MRQEQRRAVYDLLYYAKMRRDTPRNLRTSVPLMRFFVTPRLIAIASPGWFLAFLHWWGPRMMWLNFRRWLRPRTRLNELCARLTGWRHV